jgi:mono/diheme cytochrome c family protein
VALFSIPRTSQGADKPAVYLQAQAAAGATVFSNNCAGCHGVNLDGVSAPPLAGDRFMRGWQGKTADDLFYIMSHDMPADNPASLKPDEYLAVLAFVLQKNGYPAGPAALDPTKLKGITISP